ncbi:hypothetical protein GALMADRAFT_1147178 [Galerina marginata CBS 339.88]|uniref:Uncharacterized protein n=1 Tax=Galerina marginata (strain CBS 339.88) TaxID=685588 RepID=A0A067S722_GALM3|nr:hypothetical protein GALMADRAFT_1147178 [Galerina marginata CBS 339.88]
MNKANENSDESMVIATATHKWRNVGQGKTLQFHSATLACSGIIVVHPVLALTRSILHIPQRFCLT